jgi:hypothetical protein
MRLVESKPLGLPAVSRGGSGGLLRLEVRDVGVREIILPPIYLAQDTDLGIAVTLLEDGVVGHGFFDELLEQEHFRAVDDGMDAVLKGFHGGKRLEFVADEHDGGVAALGHGHFLQRLKGGVLRGGAGAEEFLHDHDLIMHLAEAHQKIAMGGGGVDFVAELLQRQFGFFQPFGRGEGDERGFIAGANEIKGLAHFNLMVGGFS